MRGRPAISAVVCTTGRSRVLPACIGALASQSIPRRSFETVVVVNGADASAAARARSACRETARVIEIGPPGLSRARNAGVVGARGAVVAFTDDDVVVGTRWLAAILRAFDDPATDGAFGSTTGPAGTPFPICEKTDEEPLVACSADALFNLGHGNNMALRRATLERIGIFDECLGAGTRNCAGEDVDMAYRVLAAGGRIAYVPEARAKHFPDLESAGPGERLRGYDVGAAAFAAKHAARGDMTPARLVLGRVEGRASTLLRYLPFNARALWRDQRAEIDRWGAMAASAARNFAAYLPRGAAPGARVTT